MFDSLWPRGQYSPWISPGQNTGVGRLSLLQGVFPTQGLNPGILHRRQILYQLSHKGSWIIGHNLATGQQQWYDLNFLFETNSQYLTILKSKNSDIPSDSAVKNLPAVQEMQETGVWSLGQEYFLEEGMATHSRILVWRIPWTEETGGLHRVTNSQKQLSKHAHKSKIAAETFFLKVRPRRVTSQLFILCYSEVIANGKGQKKEIRNIIIGEQRKIIIYSQYIYLENSWE